MCLTYDKQQTMNMKRRFARRPPGARVRMWRVIACFKGQLISIYQEEPQNVGWYRSDRMDMIGQVEVCPEKEYVIFADITEIHHGIHVFVNKKDAELGCYEDQVVMPVWCQEKDLVAAGWFGNDQSAVFDKVWINKKDLEAAEKKLRSRGMIV